MAHSTPHIQEPSTILSPNPTFFHWIRNHTSLYLSQLFGILSFIAFIASLIYYLHDSSNVIKEFLKHTQLGIHIIHIPFLLVCIITLISFYDKNREGSYRVTRAFERLFNGQLAAGRRNLRLKVSRLILRKFKRYFMLFWISMLLLYLSFLFQDFSPNEDNSVTALKRIAEVSPTDTIILYPFLSFLMNNAGVLFIFWCFSLLIAPPHNRAVRVKQKRLVHFSSFILIVVSVTYPLLFQIAKHSTFFSVSLLFDYEMIFDAISGTLNAIVLALLIARLDSKLIGLPSWLIGILYVYAGVQPLFVSFEQPGTAHEIIKTSVLIIVFIFKIYFFLIIIYVLQTGRMLNYLFCFPTLNKLVDSIFENQFTMEINNSGDNEFYFHVLKGEVVYYHSDQRFKSREGCLNALKYLRRVMKKEESYIVKVAEGTYWVGIYNIKQKTLLCQSRDLRSNDEVKELIEESVDKLPYCKLNHTNV